MAISQRKITLTRLYSFDQKALGSILSAIAVCIFAGCLLVKSLCFKHSECEFDDAAHRLTAKSRVEKKIE